LLGETDGVSMSITMFIKELDSDKALCRDAKKKTAIVNLKEPGKFEQYCEVNHFIDLAKAEAGLGKEKLAEIKKRNKIRSTGEIKAEKVKEKADLETLKPFTRHEITTWVDLGKVGADVASAIMDSGMVEDMMNGWDVLTLVESTAICSKCLLSWDKGRGCVANLMSGDSPLPEVAKKHNLKFIAGIEKYAETKQEFDSAMAKELLKEIEQLKKAITSEEKMTQRRLAGVIERLEAMAKTCATHNCKFYFAS
jgi:ribosomal protein S18